MRNTGTLQCLCVFPEDRIFYKTHPEWLNGRATPVLASVRLMRMNLSRIRQSRCMTFLGRSCFVVWLSNATRDDACNHEKLSSYHRGERKGYRVEPRAEKTLAATRRSRQSTCAHRTHINRMCVTMVAMGLKRETLAAIRRSHQPAYPRTTHNSTVCVKPCLFCIIFLTLHLNFRLTLRIDALSLSTGRGQTAKAHI